MDKKRQQRQIVAVLDMDKKLDRELYEKVKQFHEVMAQAGFNKKRALLEAINMAIEKYSTVAI